MCLIYAVLVVLNIYIIQVESFRVIGTTDWLIIVNIFNYYLNLYTKLTTHQLIPYD